MHTRPIIQFDYVTSNLAFFGCVGHQADLMWEPDMKDGINFADVVIF